MPFTLAHPAAVLPLVRRPFVASALVAGAVAPDLLYVDPIYRIATRQINGNFTLTLTHEFTSALWLDPLLALLLLAVFNLVLKRPLIALAPPALAGRLETPRRPLRIPSATVVLWTVVSAVVGAITHVVWDSFTHGDGYFVRPVAAIGLAVGGAVVELGSVDGGFGGEIGVRTGLTGLMSGGLIAVGAYVALWQLERLRRRTHVS